MDSNTIFLCDLGSDEMHATGFLLELAGYKVYSVSCLEEAVNWLSVYSEQARSLAMVLVVGSWSVLEKSALLRVLCRERNSMPLLVFDPAKKLKKLLTWNEGGMLGEDLPDVPMWGIVSLVREVMGARAGIEG